MIISPSKPRNSQLQSPNPASRQQIQVVVSTSGTESKVDGNDSNISKANVTYKQQTTLDFDTRIIASSYIKRLLTRVSLALGLGKQKEVEEHASKKSGSSDIKVQNEASLTSHATDVQNTVATLDFETRFVASAYIKKLIHRILEKKSKYTKNYVAGLLRRVSTRIQNEAAANKIVPTFKKAQQSVKVQSNKTKTTDKVHAKTYLDFDMRIYASTYVKRLVKRFSDNLGIRKQTEQQYAKSYVASLVRKMSNGISVAQLERTPVTNLDSKKSLPGKQSPRPYKQIVACPICGKVFQSRHLKAHYQQCKQQEQEKQRQRSKINAEEDWDDKAISQEGNSEMKLCQFCYRYFPWEKIADHMKLIHNILPNPLKMPAKNRPVPKLKPVLTLSPDRQRHSLRTLPSFPSIIIDSAPKTTRTYGNLFQKQIDDSRSRSELEIGKIILVKCPICGQRFPKNFLSSHMLMCKSRDTNKQIKTALKKSRTTDVLVKKTNKADLMARNIKITSLKKQGETPEPRLVSDMKAPMKLTPLTPQKKSRFKRKSDKLTIL